ncbi:MAG: MFS transporter [Candidatus Asgardarchaeia archaeon]
MKRIDKIFYGLGRLGSTILLSLVTLATIYIYTDYYHLPATWNGIANGIGKVVIAFSGFIMGYISDKTVHPKLGRRKPYVISGSVLLSFSFIMLFVPEYFIPVGNQILVFIYETVFVSAFNFFYGYLLTPYQAWMPEITEPHERVEVSNYENTFNLMGNIVGIVFSFGLGLFLEMGLTLAQIVIVFGILEIIFYMPAAIRIREPTKYIKQPNIFREMMIALKNRNYVIWILARGLMSVTFAFITSFVLLYVSDVLHFGGIDTLYFAAVLLIIVVTFFNVWYQLSKRWKIKKTMTLSLIVLIFALPLSWFIGRVPMPLDTKLMGYIFIALAAVGLSGYWLFPYAILANIAEADEIVTGESRAGMYTGFDSIPLNFFQAFSLALGGFIWDLPEIGHYIWGPFYAIFLVIGLIVFQYVETDPDFDALRAKYGRTTVPNQS